MLLSAVILFLPCFYVNRVHGKWVEGKINTKDNWAFLSRFCFLSMDGQFEYLIEFDREAGIPNLLLYYDDDSQWPSVYHSSKSCKEREAILNKAGQNQMIRLSHWYPDMEYSGCVLKKENKELPASKSTPSTTTTTTTHKQTNATTIQQPANASYYDQFLKATTTKPTPRGEKENSTIWYELSSMDGYNSTTTEEIPEDSLWEHVGLEANGSRKEDLTDVEVMFESHEAGRKIKRSTFELYKKKRKLNRESNSGPNRNVETGKYVVSCHNARRFRSARERWWFIAISNCDNDNGLDVKYRFLMTNGPDGDFWHEHFSADEFYVLPILIAYTTAYVLVMIAVVMCSIELKSRHLLHTTYKLFLISIVAQHSGVSLRSIAYAKYAVNGFGNDNAKVAGEFLCGVSEMAYLLLLVLMAKGYTITRARLKVGFTVKLTIFMCSYFLIYIILFIYQAKAFDPGEVLYLYESPAGYSLIVLRIFGWCMFAYATFFTCKKFPEKNVFYCPFFICGTLWFYAGPLFILTANSYIDKWVRESVVVAVLLFITFTGHVSFLLLTLPVFANKNFPYHVRTSQIGVLEATNGSALDNFGHNAYHPSNGGSHTVIIPLTRRTEELIGSMYQQYMATAPPLSIENDPTRANKESNPLQSISPSLQNQDSTETNTSEDIKPILSQKNDIFTIDSQSSSLDRPVIQRDFTILRSRRNILEPIRRDMQPPKWCLAKGPDSRTDKLKSRNIGHKESHDTEEGPTENSQAMKNGSVPSETNTNQNNTVNGGVVDLFTITKN